MPMLNCKFQYNFQITNNFQFYNPEVSGRKSKPVYIAKVWIFGFELVCYLEIIIWKLFFEYQKNLVFVVKLNLRNPKDALAVLFDKFK